jgi:hypothetical protein
MIFTIRLEPKERRARNSAHCAPSPFHPRQDHHGDPCGWRSQPDHEPPPAGVETLAAADNEPG